MVQQSRKSAKAREQDEDDLIGSAEPDEPVDMNLGVVWGGVTASWLQQVFGGDRNVVKKKLAEGRCKVVGANRGAPTYSLAEAAACLVAPKFDIEKHLQNMRYNDLPPMLQAAYWDGKLKRQQFEEKAGQLWHDADVQTVLGDLFFSFTTTVKLWVEDVERADGITPAQRKTIVSLTDALLEATHQMLVDAPKRSRTTSSIDERAEEDLDSVI
jgi:hypothetical protein